MPDWTIPYAPALGDNLTAAGLNDNFYTATPGDNTSLEIANGRIETVNFDPAFEVLPRHVRRNEAGEAVTVGTTLRADYFSDLFTHQGADAAFLPVGGVCLTFRQRFDVSMALFSASAHATIWRQFGPANGAFNTRLQAPAVVVKAFFQTGDGAINLLDHTQRECPQTVHFGDTSANPRAEISTVEAMCARHWNLVHPRMTGQAAPCGPLLAGYHTFGLCVLVRQNLTGQDTTDPLQDMTLALNGVAPKVATPAGFYSGIQRIRLHVREVSAIRLL
jgi:hypothetical protein